MLLTVVATGSSANCYLLNAGTESLVLDAGVPIRKLVPVVDDFRAISGCVITHEHGDHSRGAVEMVRRGIKTFCSAGTKRELNVDGLLSQLNVLQPLKPVKARGFTILPFQTQHDAAEPFGFVIRYDLTGETVLYATDTYYLRYTFPGIHYWIVECNYTDEVMNEQQADGKLTATLRNRLKESHMSLNRLLDALKANDLSDLKAIVLVHLSDERSNERVMVQAVKEVTGIEEVIAADAGMTIQLNLNPF